MRKDGLNIYCKSCKREYLQEYAKSDIGKQAQAKYRDKNRAKIREYNLKRNFGINMRKYKKLFKKQEGKCAICETHQSELDRVLAVDHNHENGKIRGLLCSACNKAIGFLKDNPQVILKAHDYVTLSR